MAPAVQHTLADQKQGLVASYAVQGQQALAVFGLPLVLLRFRRPFSLSRLTREYSVLSLVAGPVTGAGYGLYQTQTKSDADVVKWATERRASWGLKRREDYGVVGGAIGALALPAVLLRRAPLVQLATAGFSLGTAAGVLSHYAAGPVVPGAVPDAPVSGVGKGGLSGL
ncbi:hypothetical protein JCM3775_000540 [Rhodotorula graminis]